MKRAPVILWFRQDLRLADNAALVAAHETGAPVLPLFILDDETPGLWHMGAASRWWLHHSLASLDKSLGGALVLERGEAEKILPALLKKTGATAVFANRQYEPWAAARDARLINTGISLHLSDGALLHDPDALCTKSGNPFRVFTPFWKALQKTDIPAPFRPVRAELVEASERNEKTLRSWNLLPTHPDWAKSFASAWQPGEKGAQNRLRHFIAHGLKRYKADRDRMDFEDGVSRLSPHLHFGEISPRQVWAAVHILPGAEPFLRQLAWREFCAHLLHHFPDLPDSPLDAKFAAFPWAKNAGHLRLWQKGQTGYPVVDAAMRQLWQTGWMHNRARMIVASFLVKDLRSSWQPGEQWFWDTLVDADLANNAAGWQWVAGCGADAAPFFRVFNPVLQGEKFDPDGNYVRRFVPELSRLPAKWIHKPWAAPPVILEKAGVVLGKTYPKPIVDHATARDAALASFSSLKKRR